LSLTKHSPDKISRVTSNSRFIKNEQENERILELCGIAWFDLKDKAGH